MIDPHPHIEPPQFITNARNAAIPKPTLAKPPILNYLESAIISIPLAYRKRFRVAVTQAEYNEIRAYFMQEKSEFVNMIDVVYIFPTEFPSSPIFKLEFPE